MNENVTVREVMDPEFVGVSESDGVLETAELLLQDEADLAVVLRGSDPVGVVSDRHILAHLVDGGDPGTATIEDVMTETVPTVDPDVTLPAARDQMSTWSTSWLVVTEGGAPDGIVTEHDILATSVLDSEATTAGPEDRREEMETQLTATAAATDSEGAATDRFDDQGICEQCGSLARDLASFNGQLLCADCRDI